MDETIQHLLDNPAYEARALIAWRDILQEYPFLSENKLKHMISRRHVNGSQAAGVFVRVGNAILINKPRFAIWLADHERRIGDHRETRREARV